MYHLFNKIRLSPIGGIAQPSLIFFSLYIVCCFFFYLCTICLGDCSLLTPCKLEKILHLCICTNKNNGIVQDNSQRHAILQSLNNAVKDEEKTKQNSSKERKFKKRFSE